jgi:hypothetical protein
MAREGLKHVPIGGGVVSLHAHKLREHSATVASLEVREHLQAFGHGVADGWIRQVHSAGAQDVNRLSACSAELA